MIDLNSKSGFSERVQYFIDQAIEKQTEPPRDYLGASSVGHFCERFVQYTYLAALGEVEKKQVSPRIRRIFDRGNVYEEKARRWLKDAGFMFGRRVGSRNEFTDFDGIFKGHVDGVVTGWKGSDPCPIILPALWECKCLGNKGFNAIEKDGLNKYSPTYWVQIHIYMAYLKLDRTLYTVVNADTMECLHLMIEFDQAVADEAKYRVQRIINAVNMGELVPRCTSDRNYFICKSYPCDYYQECWK